MPAQALFIFLMIIVALLAAILRDAIIGGFNLRELIALTAAYTVLLIVPPLIAKWLKKKE